MNDVKKNTTVEEPKPELRVDKHIDFVGNMKTNVISSIEMADNISALLSILSDFYGCKVKIHDGRTGMPNALANMPIGSLYVDLYFKDMGPASKDTIKNLKSISKNSEENADGKKPNLMARYARIANTGPQRLYDVTPQTLAVLEKFMIRGSKTNWNNHIYETTTNIAPYGKEEVVVCITGVSLIELINAMYGTEGEDGTRYEYMALPSTIIPGKTDEFILQVTQLDTETVNSIQKALGVYTTNVPFHTFRR